VSARAIWIAWEKQRRTTELAGVLGVPLHRYLFRGPYMLRLVVVLVQSFLQLCRTRPEVLIVQNPSIVLAAFACVMRRPFRMRVLVDRHSNFKLETSVSRKLIYRAFHALSRYSVRRADLTIVTNEYLRDVVQTWGGRATILPDKLPALDSSRRRDLGPGWHVLYVCSYDEDEPLGLVLEAARLLGEGARLHISGDHSRADRSLVAAAPDNVEFTGYLSDADYEMLLASCDVVLTLTTQDHTLQCGAYEAVALAKPLVFAAHPEMVGYFHKGSVATKLGSRELADALALAWTERTRLTQESCELRQELDTRWRQQFAAVEDWLGAREEAR
jgi:glycosyltransferase involved in cell wall biosynthesis